MPGGQQTGILNGESCSSRSFYIYIYSFSWRFYPKRLTIPLYVRGCTPLEQLRV